MIIVDQEGTLINSDRMSAIAKVQDKNGIWQIVAFEKIGGAAVNIGSYNTKESAEMAMEKLEMAFSIPRNTFEMPIYDMPEGMQIVLGGDENTDPESE